MKKLYLLRHTKSDWDHQLSDFERPLNERGERDAPVVARYLNEMLGSESTFVTSSPAVRTRMTMAPLLELLGGKTEVEWNESLYESNVFEYLRAIQSIPDSYEQALVTGHNPSIAETVEMLIGGRASGAMIEVPTGCVIRIDLNVTSWSAARKSTGVLRSLITPKMLHRFLGNEDE